MQKAEYMRMNTIQLCKFSNDGEGWDGYMCIQYLDLLANLDLELLWTQCTQKVGTQVLVFFLFTPGK